MQPGALVGLAVALGSSSACKPPLRRVDSSFVLAGPLARPCGFARESDIPGRWATLAEELFALLGTHPSEHDARVHQYYLPLYFWLRRLVDERAPGAPAVCAYLYTPKALARTQSAENPPDLQGGGKSTLVSAMEALFRADGGKRCFAASLDDFYLPHDGLERVAREHAGNRLLQVRGNPLTHDIALCVSTLRQLRAQVPGGPAVRVPRFDKSKFDGRGNRAPLEEWAEVAEPQDIILLEGWCLGFRAKPSESPDAGAPFEKSAGVPFERVHVPELEPINAALREFEEIYAQLV
ncbi:hypothetical protein T492DRAFT_832914 [Pavlovales sp. CCMP2436]|nr:hypothetical protein T492DRAFT_832914 [Pavlovales sp. CCMP2436]